MAISGVQESPLVPRPFSISSVPILLRAHLAFRPNTGYLKLELLGLDFRKAWIKWLLIHSPLTLLCGEQDWAAWLGTQSWEQHKCKRGLAKGESVLFCFRKPADIGNASVFLQKCCLPWTKFSHNQANWMQKCNIFFPGHLQFNAWWNCVFRIYLQKLFFIQKCLLKLLIDAEIANHSSNVMR